MSRSRTYGLSLERDLIRVDVDRVMYAIEISRIREIVNPLAIIELPRECDFVLGVAEYRDEVVAVVDLRSLFGLAPADEDRRTKWIILESGQGLVAVVVDGVRDVFASSGNQRRQVPVLDQHQVERGIQSAFQHDDGLVFLLDAERIAEPAFDVRQDEIVHLPSEAP